MMAHTLQSPLYAARLVSDICFSESSLLANKISPDDISNTEATDSLGLGDEIDVLEEQLLVVNRNCREAEKEAESLKDKKVTLRETMDECDDEIEKWEALQEKNEDGKTVYAPSMNARKRKRSISSIESGDDDEKLSQESQASNSGPPLTAEDISTKIQELKDAKKEARRGRSEIEAQVKEVNNKIKEMKSEIRAIEDNRSRICIAARNHYSKSAIQLDFAAGIKEVGQASPTTGHMHN
jgi:chromosome segregation ATPase